MISDNRQAAVQALSGATLDVLVIGGGIVGSGIARDAAMRGLRVGLVEQYDFAFGTSSRSSRLLHGGLRYLAQGRIGLVHEASVEKRVVHRIAPHLSEPLPFLFPTYTGTSWPKWKLRIGVKLYDLLCGGRNLGRSSGMSVSDMTRMLPQLETRGLTGGVRYFDGFTNDARLVIDTLRSAAAAGATVVNYCRLESAEPRRNAWVCTVRDRTTDALLEVETRCVVNATGPWAQGFSHSAVKLRLTKGVHLVIDRERLPVPEAVVLTEGQRILFVIPWGQRVILGTTDTDFDGEPDRVHADAADVEYILGVVNRAFPSAALSEADVISTWAGVRPLINSGTGGPSDISRSHQIRSPQPGWWDVAGGKLTTYRLMAEQTVDAIEPYLGRAISQCRTAQEPLLPHPDVEPVSGLVPPPLTQSCVEHYCREEWARHLEDVMIRRGGWHYYEREAPAIAARVADWMREILGWDEARQHAELRRYLNGGEPSVPGGQRFLGASTATSELRPTNGSATTMTPGLAEC